MLQRRLGGRTWKVSGGTVATTVHGIMIDGHSAGPRSVRNDTSLQVPQVADRWGEVRQSRKTAQGGVRCKGRMPIASRSGSLSFGKPTNQARRRVCTNRTSAVHAVRQMCHSPLRAYDFAIPNELKPGVSVAGETCFISVRLQSRMNVAVKAWWNSNQHRACQIAFHA